jgi:very-short-patch-repair endonuclease
MPNQRTGKKELFRQTLVGRARHLRQNLTIPELRLLQRLRGDQILGLRFRRQYRIGSYIADFYCHAAKLVIEVDGDSHDEREEYDARRTCWLSQEGLKVLRFTNDDILKFEDAVVKSILDSCSHAQCPSPRGERE